MYISGWKKVAHNISEAYEYDKKVLSGKNYTSTHPPLMFATSIHTQN